MSDLRKAAQMALEALITAEAGLSDIGDADREPGDDVAWCESRAAQALAEPRKAITYLRAALAQPEPEPVAWRWLGTSVIRKRIPKTAEADAWQPLYEARVAIPPQRKPLTEAEIENLGPLSFTWRDMVQFARAIEAAHGVGGEK